jgi:hypothetical protein
MTKAKIAAPTSEMATTRGAPIRSERTPPGGRAITAAMANPAVRVPAPVRSQS